MLKGIVPILRIFDEEQARSFYVEYLGFKLDWEHRFEEDLPLYMQVSLDGVAIHLSGHYGDCTPGAALRINTSDLNGLCESLNRQKHKYSRPGITNTPWGLREMEVIDPSGNRIIFYQQDNE